MQQNGRNVQNQVESRTESPGRNPPGGLCPVPIKSPITQMMFTEGRNCKSAVIAMSILYVRPSVRHTHVLYMCCAKTAEHIIKHYSTYTISVILIIFILSN